MCLALAVGSHAGAATSGTVVGATVPSATSIDVTACQSQTSATSFGTVLPGASVVTGADCNVVFGSSNDTSMLRVHQTDALGVAMSRPSHGAIDTGFGVGGTRMIDPADDDAIVASAIAPDGDIVVAGHRSVAGAEDAFLARLQPDGTLDPAFGSGSGMVTYSASAASDRAQAVAIGADGSITIGGITAVGIDDTSAFVARFESDGTLRTSFGTGGRTEIIAGPEIDTFEDVAIDASGRIAVAGYSDQVVGAGVGLDWIVGRLTADGAPDLSFNGTGLRRFDLGGPANSNDSGFAVAFDSSGRIVSGGFGVPAAGTGDAAVVRFTEAGAFDPTFGGGDGIATADVTAADEARGLAIDANGRILLSGQSNIGVDQDAFVARFTTAGVLDTTFGIGGVSSVPMSTAGGHDAFEGLVIQDDRRIVAAGHAQVGGQWDAAVFRLLENGTLDTSFDGDGKAFYAPSAGLDTVHDVLMHRDGRILLTGGATNADFDGAVTRLDSTGVADFSGDWTTGSDKFGACLHGLVSGTAVWALAGAGNCTTTQPANWRPIPATAADAGAAVASTASGVANATARFRFGFRTIGPQPPGIYAAGVSFTVVAPSA